MILYCEPQYIIEQTLYLPLKSDALPLIYDVTLTDWKNISLLTFAEYLFDNWVYWQCNVMQSKYSFIHITGPLCIEVPQWVASLYRVPGACINIS